MVTSCTRPPTRGHHATPASGWRVRSRSSQFRETVHRFASQASGLARNRGFRLAIEARHTPVDRGNQLAQIRDQGLRYQDVTFVDLGNTPHWRCFTWYTRQEQRVVESDEREGAVDAETLSLLDARRGRVHSGRPSAPHARTTAPPMPT